MRISDFVYIHYYPDKKCKCQNKLFVIGVLRKFFKYRLFAYVNCDWRP